MCSLVVGNDSIGCDGCFAWFHLLEMCMGLSLNAVHVTLESEDSGALLYLCTACRLKPGPGTWTISLILRNEDDGKSQLIMQPFQSVKGLYSEVAILSQKISTTLIQGQMTANSQGLGSDGTHYSEVPRSMKQTKRQTPNNQSALSFPQRAVQGSHKTGSQRDSGAEASPLPYYQGPDCINSFWGCV